MQTMERSTRSSRRDAAAAAVRVPSTSSSVPAGPPGSQSDGGQFLCIECSETFATKLQLNAHLQSHTATKPYVCSHCGRGFHHQVFLQMHERSHEHGSPHNQTSAAKPSPSRVISTRSSKVVAPVEEDKVHVKDPQSKHGPSPNITVEFRKEKPTPQVVAPIECVTRLTRGKAPTLYHQDEEPEKRSAFGFHVSKYSNNTVHLMDAFGNSIELLTEVFNLYASTEPEGGNAAENTVPSDHAVELSSTVLQHPCQSNTASPVNEEACRNGSLESSVSAVRNGVSPKSDVSPAEEGLDDLKVDDATPSATVAPENFTQDKCKSPGGTRSASSDLPAENTSLAVPEPSDDVLAEQMETDSKGFTGKRDTTTSMLADSAASSSAPAGRTAATSNSEEHATILSSDLLPAAAVETSTQQSGGVENLLSGDRDIVSSESVSTSQENACNAAHKDNGFLENVAELTSSAESKVVSPTDEPDQPKLQPEAGKDHQCHTRPSGESHVLNEGQQEIQAETAAETSAQSEHTDITCSVSPPINLHQYSALTTSADEETERSGADEAGRSPAGDLTKEMNLTESERSPVSLPQSESEPSQQVCSDPDALQECVLSETAEGDRATKELGEGAADDAEIPDRSGLSDCKAVELVDKELNLFPSESLAEAQYSTKTFSQPQSEEGDIEGHREEEGSISDHMSPATPEDDLSNQVTLDTCTSQEDTMLSETGNRHLPIGMTDAEPSSLLQQVKVQGTTELDSDEIGEQTENPTFSPDQTKVRDISQAETGTGSDASSQEMTELGTGTILSNEDRVEFTEQNHEPALVTEEQNHEPALVTEEQNHEPALVTEEQNHEPALVTEEQNHEPALVTEEQNHEPALVTEEQNHEPALVTEEQNHEPALVTEEQNHEPALVTEEQNHEPALVTEEQNHEHALVTEEQNHEPALVTEEQNHEPALVTEEQNHEPALVTEEQNHEPALVTEEQNHEPALVTEEQNPEPALVTAQTITVSATNTAECADKSPRATSNSAVLSPEEDGLIDSATPSAQGLHPEGSPSCEMEICHVENKDSLLPPDILGPQSSDHPPRKEPEHLVPTDTAEQVPLNVDIAEKESDDQLRDLKGKGLLSDSAEPSKPTQNHNEGEPEAKEQPSASILTTCETESSAASSLSNDCNHQDVIDKTTAPSNPDPSAEPNTEGPLCLAPSSNTPSVPDTGTSVGAGEALTELPAGQTSSQEEKLETSKEPLLSPKSKLRQAISEMSVYCMSGKLLTVGAKCLLCDQKLRTYRGEISSPICRKCRLNKKNRDPCFMTELPPHSQSSLERDLLTKASPCRIKREAAESEDSLKPLESSDTEAETAEKMYKCHKCDKSFALSVLLAGHVKFHSLPKCLTCGRLMRLRFKARRIPRNCRVCTNKLKDKRKAEGNESSDENKSDESLTVSQASLKDKDDPEQFPHGDNKYRPRSQKVVKTKLSTRKFHHTRRVGKKAAGSVSASKRGVGAPLKSTYDLSKSTSIKPYKCTKCPMAFKRPIYLVKHMRKHMPSALHNPFTALKGSPHHSDSDLDPKNLTYSDVLGVRPGEKKVLRRKRQKQGSDEPAMEQKRRPVQKPRLSKPNLAFVDSATLSSDGYSVGNPCQVLNQGEGGRVMTPFGGFSAKEEANETPISDHNPCKEDPLSDSGTSSPDESTSGDKPHMCQHCGKRFQHYRSLHLHVLVHTAIQCESCGRRLRFKKRAGRRSKKCRLCRLQEKEQVFEPPLPAATKKPLTLGKARGSTVLPPKRTRIMKNLKGQSLAELKQMSKGMKQLLVKGLAQKPRKQKPGSELLKVAGRKKKVKDLPELSQVDPLGIDHPESSPSTSAIKLEDGTFSDSAGKVMFVSTMKMKKAKGLVNEHEAASEETQEPLHDQPASDKLPQCSVCDQEFENQELLFAHMQSHADVLLFPCPHCPHRFHKKPLLKIHLFTHFKDRPHRCTDCNKSFSRINHLNMHRRVHMGIRPYSCPDCPSSFRHKVSLLVHRYSHSKVLPIDLKPYQCAYCAKRFLRSDHLEVHQRFHTGECPFQCPDCDKTFPSKARLSIHSRVHSGVRPHSCPTCQRSFIHKANLERHLQKHTGELAFSCVKCSVRFPSLVTLAQHKHTHRREEVFSCVHCEKRFLYKKVKLGDGQVGGIKRRRRLKKEDNPEPGVKRPRLKKNPTGTKLDKEGNPIKAKRIKKEKDTEEEQGQEKPSESLDMEESAPKKGKRKQPEAKGAKVKRIKKGKRKQPEAKGAKVKRVKKEKATSSEEQGPETAETTEESATEKGKKKIPKTIKVRKIRKKATSEGEDASTESGTNKVRRKQTEGNPQKAEGKPEKGTGNVRGKREKVQKEGVKLKPQKEESTKSKKSSEGRKQQGEDKPKNSRLGVKRGPYKKRAPGEKKTRIVRVKVKSVQVKLKPGRKKKQVMKEKKEKV
uniref:C2H2-type domain-containing protein n=1 Tax=Leptobrachium leishanense TaxID=445787 RepID=A0A8C5WDM1_9ANUR